MATKKMKLSEAIEARIKEGYNARKKDGTLKEIRANIVKYTTHILTGSHQRMKEIESNPDLLESWVKANREFIEQEYRAQNIVRFVIHRDETTPHIHAVTVNLTEDGRLCAKEIIGNKIKMTQR